MNHYDYELRAISDCFILAQHYQSAPLLLSRQFSFDPHLAHFPPEHSNLPRSSLR